MKENILSVVSTAFLALINLRDEVTAWVGLVCTLAVTVVTCAVNIHRLWRDRDKDKKQEEQAEQVEDSEAKDNE